MCSAQGAGEISAFLEIRRWQERKKYVERAASCAAFEQTDDMLSTTIDDSDFRNLAYAMRVYLDPDKLGSYHRVLSLLKGRMNSATENTIALF